MFLNTDTAVWRHQPTVCCVSDEEIRLTTPPNTDLWQRTYYGFQRDNAPALLAGIAETSFTFTVKTQFASKRRFDQCGILLYHDSENWAKASTEYENEQFQCLGSVVTNHGYSDWGNQNIPNTHTVIYYRLSRRGSDFCFEYSFDGCSYAQMRVFHLFEGGGEVQLGVYACSPGEYSFDAVFTELSMGACVWEPYV